ncbi:hypodermin-A-like, partial [Drosophila serrata]|uniref:hypodermin-A-like n=1 Tax=Drosophila serrata TaxID=7274 RepID=UPI000A1D1B58
LIGLLSANRIPVPKERIVNGKNVKIQEIPWQVAVLVNGNALCGGVVYKKNIVLTAAHCMGLPYDYSVRAGSPSKSSGGQIVKVAKSKVRKGYDIGMLFLSSPLKFDNFTQPIELADKSSEGETPAIVSGWGGNSFNPNMPGPDYLQGANVTVKDRCRCQKAFNALAVLLAEDPRPLKAHEICASLYGYGSCHGDSGGSLVSWKDKKLIGIVSHGFDA